MVNIRKFVFFFICILSLTTSYLFTPQAGLLATNASAQQVVVTVIVTPTPTRTPTPSLTPTPTINPTLLPTSTTTGSDVPCQSLKVDTNALGFAIPSFGDILTFAIRGVFTIAGLAALFMLLLGALGWVTSGGDKDSISRARQKIQAAIVGVLLIIVVLAIIWTMENVVFARRICFGLSCPVTIPSLLKTTGKAQSDCISPAPTPNPATVEPTIIDDGGTEIPPDGSVTTHPYNEGKGGS